jgi:hypothetical protein
MVRSILISILSLFDVFFATWWYLGYGGDTKGLSRKKTKHTQIKETFIISKFNEVKIEEKGKRLQFKRAKLLLLLLNFIARTYFY